MAVGQYQEALDVAVAANEAEMANEIRSTAAVVYESLGQTAGALAMLDRISGEEEGGTEVEVVDSQYEKGRLLNQDYRFAEAVPVLTEALATQQQSEEVSAWGPTALGALASLPLLRAGLRR